MKKRSRNAVWRIPVALGLLTCIGLVAGLIADDLWDVVSWIGLGVPLVVIVWCVWFVPGSSREPRSKVSRKLPTAEQPPMRRS